MEKIKLAVEGMKCDMCNMKCDMCKAKVEKALSEIEGVTSAVADPKKGTAVVTADRKIADDVLVRAVIDAGFRAKVKHGLLG